MLSTSGVRERGGGSGCVGSRQEIVDLLLRLSFESKGNKGHGKFHRLMDDMLSREKLFGMEIGQLVEIQR